MKDINQYIWKILIQNYTIDFCNVKLMYGIVKNSL